jgi:hypothetical protein
MFTVARWPNSGPLDSKMPPVKILAAQEISGLESGPIPKVHNCGLILTIIGKTWHNNFQK